MPDLPGFEEGAVTGGFSGCVNYDTGWGLTDGEGHHAYGYVSFGSGIPVYGGDQRAWLCYPSGTHRKADGHGLQCPENGITYDVLKFAYFPSGTGFVFDYDNYYMATKVALSGDNTGIMTIDGGPCFIRSSDSSMIVAGISYTNRLLYIDQYVVNSGEDCTGTFSERKASISYPLTPNPCLLHAQYEASSQTYTVRGSNPDGTNAVEISWDSNVTDSITGFGLASMGDSGLGTATYVMNYQFGPNINPDGGSVASLTSSLAITGSVRRFLEQGSDEAGVAEFDLSGVLTEGTTYDVYVRYSGNNGSGGWCLSGVSGFSETLNYTDPVPGIVNSFNSAPVAFFSGDQTVYVSGTGYQFYSFPSETFTFSLSSHRYLKVTSSANADDNVMIDAFAFVEPDSGVVTGCMAYDYFWGYSGAPTGWPI